MASDSLGGYRLDTGGRNHAAFSPPIAATVDLRNFFVFLLAIASGGWYYKNLPDKTPLSLVELYSN
jgi:hypothetical protein